MALCGIMWHYVALYGFFQKTKKTIFFLEFDKLQNIVKWVVALYLCVVFLKQ